jgi:glycosyltransferase involved in cell wall biosynthesis
LTRFLFVTYYGPPYRSGLTIHVGRIAAGLVAAGSVVDLVVGRHDRELPPREVVDGIRIRRLPVAARVDRGVLLPSLVPVVLRAAARADAVVLTTPLAEAGPLAALLRGRTPLAVMHVCDPQVPGGLVGRALVAEADVSARVAARRADLVLALSRDYAEHSRVLAGLLDRVVAIPPPIDVTAFTRDERAAPDRPAATPLRVGFLGRLTHEKGLDRLVSAVALVRRPVKLVLAGPGEGLPGGSEAGRLRAQARELGVDVELPGALPDGELADFYRALDVFALPSVSSLEAWGIVQVEAMLCGTPVVASALPGVRELVRRTGMGLTVPPGDVGALARALEAVAERRPDFVRSRRSVIEALELDGVLQRHVQVLQALAAG